MPSVADPVPLLVTVTACAGLVLPTVLASNARLAGEAASDTVGAGPPPPGKIWNSAICAAGQPELAVKFSRTCRAVAVVRGMVTVLPLAGLKV